MWWFFGFVVGVFTDAIFNYYMFKHLEKKKEKKKNDTDSPKEEDKDLD